MKNQSKAKNLSLEKSMAKHGFVFVSPVILGFVLIYGEVLLNSVVFSFSDISPGTSSYIQSWVGWNNYYRALLVDPDFIQNLANTLTALLYQIPLVIVFSLFVASILSRRIPGRTFFRTVLFIPAILVTGAIASSNNNAMSSALGSLSGIDTGVVNKVKFSMADLQSLFGNSLLNSSVYSYIVNAINNIFNVINMCGVQILIFIAGLQSISPSIYEAASIEGANGWDCYWKLTFPMIIPMIYVNTVYTIVDSFVGSSNVIMRSVYSVGIEQSKIGLASAMSWIYFAVIAVVLLLVVLILNKMLKKHSIN